MIEFAQWNMRRELSLLWQEAFGDRKRIPDFFLNNIFSPRDCLVFRIGKEIAAAVYLLPASVLRNGRTVQAHYIFAAATAQKFRSRGYMSALLAYAAIAGAERGDRFSVVLPAGDGLYQFYEEAGYTDFFQMRCVKINREELSAIAGGYEKRGTTLPDFTALNRFRAGCLSFSDGSVLWDNRMFRLSVSMNQIYGDRFFCVFGKNGPAYALCRTENTLCTVLESFASDGAFPEFSSALLHESHASEFLFRLPLSDTRFQEQGNPQRFGMIKPLDGRSLEKFSPQGPYLGLAMD